MVSALVTTSLSCGWVAACRFRVVTPRISCSAAGCCSALLAAPGRGDATGGCCWPAGSLAALIATQLAQTLLIRWRSPLVDTAAGSAVALVGIAQTPGVSHFFGCAQWDRRHGPGCWAPPPPSPRSLLLTCSKDRRWPDPRARPPLPLRFVTLPQPRLLRLC